ncbi:MAG: FGGY-family carbohydrate kinase [Clostridiales bacterium]|jgi:sugar (pentulose or hexulose) kinase|nr:FGGY-family carbohydrate kinase [Clostridiales bacterium]
MAETGKTSLGIELGSTRIKAQLIDARGNPIASGGFDWENRLEGGYWTYPAEDVWLGLQAVLKQLTEQCPDAPENLGAIGISAMMHGYLAFDKSGRLLAPFRTWRNTTAEQAANILTERFNFNIPIRWNVAHLYQAILNGEKHVKDIAFITTLSGYIHWKLTGEKVIGIGDASGMFPIDSNTNNYNELFIGIFDSLIEDKGFAWELSDILPKIKTAGETAGRLTEDGAELLGVSGWLKPGIPLCPPEGDGGTGMVATNSVTEFTGNVSAGTSIFAMVVLDRELSKLHTEVDMVTTPAGKPVAMVHCNNCTSDIDAWVKLFGEAAGLFGVNPDKSDLYAALYNKALEGEPDCGGLLSYNYYSGEPLTGFDEGRPLLVRTPDSRFSLANLMRAHLYSAVAALKLGMNILTNEEHVKLDQMLGHGGLFKTEGVAQRFMAAALNVPVAVMESAAEGGAWGIAILASYMVNKEPNETLVSYLNNKVFAGNTARRVEPDERDAAGFMEFMERYVKGLPIERAAVGHM